MNSRLKNAQPDESVDGIAEANQSIPQANMDQNLECDSNDTETVPQESSSTTTTGEVSSTHDQPVTTSGVSSSGNYSDSDEADDCPVFEYSAESMQVAKDSNDSPETTSKEVEPSAEDTMENDEDLVQLDDDEHFGNETGISEEQISQTQADNNQTIESPVASPETTTNTGTECSEPAPLNNECESSESAPQPSNQEKDTEDVSEIEDHMAESSEAQPCTTDALEKDANENNAKSGIEGMDTEMISEDEHELHDDVSKEVKADKANNNRKSDRDDSFKKVSKSNKDRNYRDKKEKSDNKSRSKRSKSRSVRRSRSRSSRRSKSRSIRRSKSSSFSRSRSRSRNRNRRGSGRRPHRKDHRGKRQEIQRYDVRTVIADRQPRTYKDKYGRDTSRTLRSASPRRAKSRSHSRSISPGTH